MKQRFKQRVELIGENQKEQYMKKQTFVWWAGISF